MRGRRWVVTLVGVASTLLVFTSAPSEARATGAATAAAAANTMVGGKKITGAGVACSSGFNVKNGSGDSVMVTAGHCGAETWYLDGTVYFGNTARRVVSATEGDFQTVPPGLPGQWALPPDVHYQGANVPVHGRMSASNGMTACWRGGNSAVSRCGTVYAADSSSTIEGTTFTHTFKVHGCAIKGDSGSPVFTFVAQAGTNQLYALGIIQGVTVDANNKCVSNPNIVVQPIGKVLNNWNLTLKTD